MTTVSSYWEQANRRLTRRRLLKSTATASAGVAGLALVGCGDDDDDDSAPEDTTPSANGTQTGASPTTSKDLKDMTLEEMRSTFSGSRLKDLPGQADGPVYGGVARFASRTPTSFDPTSPSGGLMASYMFANNQLITIRVHDFVDNPNFMEFEGQLADGMPEQPDDTTFIFKLHENVAFQDVDPVNGRAFTAEDVIYCTDVYRESPAQAPTYEEVDNIEAVDDYTVKFTMQRPAAYFISSFSVPFHWIFSHEQYESEEGLARRPIGTGPFIFESSEDGGGYSFVKNPNYWRKDSRTDMQLPYLDGIETTFFPNPAQSIAAFRSGQFDHVWPQNFDTWLDVMESNPDSVTQVTTPPPSFQPYVAMRLDLEPLSDPRVRRALSLMIDRDAIIDSLAQGMAGYGYGQDWTYFGREWPWESTELGDYNKLDVAEARSLLSAAAIEDLELDFLLTQSAGFNFEVWQAVAGMWDQEGIRTNIDAPQDPAKWLSQFYGGTYSALAGSGLLGPGMDPDTFTYHAMHSQSPKNNFHINDPVIDELTIKQRQTFDKEERTEVLREIMALDLDEVTRLWLVTPYKINLRKPHFFSLIDTEAAWNPVGWGSVGLEYAWTLNA